MTAPLWTCPCCGEASTELPALTYTMPQEIFLLPPEERRARAVMTPEFGAMDIRTPQARGWIRAVLIAPILGRRETIEFGLWLEVDNDDHRRYCQTFHSGQEGMSCRGLLSTDLPSWREHGIELLPCSAQWSDKHRPRITLDPHDHPMARECREGVPPERVAALAHGVLGCPTQAPPARRGMFGALRRLLG